MPSTMEKQIVYQPFGRLEMLAPGLAGFADLAKPSSTSERLLPPMRSATQ